MDASVHDYIWKGHTELPVDTSAWKASDWYRQIDEFLSRNRTAMNSWRGFSDLAELITKYMKLSHGVSEVIFTDAITSERGFRGTSINTHARTFDCIDCISSGSADGVTFVGLLLLTRKGFWARLDITYRCEEAPAPGLYNRVIVTRWHLEFLGHGSMEKIMEMSCHRGAFILREFLRIMLETEDALESALEQQKKSRREYQTVLSRMKF